MGKSTIPDEIKACRPGPCTEVKLIGGHYYVYKYESVKLGSGKWGKKTLGCIGSIIPGEGFSANKKEERNKSGSKRNFTTLEYGQYALIEYLAKDIYESLKQHFNANQAAQIFSYATILCANGFMHLDQVGEYYEQSWLSERFRHFTFKMGEKALGSMLEDLKKNETNVIDFEEDALKACSSQIAIDGHAIRSCSDENDLGEAGYKFQCLKEDQVNLLMGYDINTKMPLFSHMFRGSCNDKSTIDSLNRLLNFSGILFVVDRGFYSALNMSIFSSNGNRYIIPVPSSTNIFKNAMKDFKLEKSFYYRVGKKHARVEYKCCKVSDTVSVYVFRDIEENEKSRYNYQRNIENGKKGYTPENFEKYKEFFGVYVLQTNSDLSAEDVFGTYKKRWGIETFYQYIKNDGNYNGLKFQSYYKEHGFAFILLIAGQIHQKLLAAVKSLNCNTKSVHDLLLAARAMKMSMRSKYWHLENQRTKDLDVFKKLGFNPPDQIPIT